MFEDWKEEFRKVKESLDDDFEEVVYNAYENSVKKEPVNYKTTTKAVNNAKKILAIGAAALIIVGVGYSAYNKKQEQETNSIVSEYIDKNYNGIISSYRTDGNEYVAYNNKEIAQNIMGYEDFDKAVYAAWYRMEYQKAQNMNEVFNYLPGEGNFYSYLRDKEFVDENGSVDIDAYSTSMKTEIVESQSKGSK